MPFVSAIPPGGAANSAALCRDAATDTWMAPPAGEGPERLLAKALRQDYSLTLADAAGESPTATGGSPVLPDLADIGRKWLQEPVLEMRACMFARG